MAGSTFGKIFKVTTWGESHGPASGCVIDGCPAGLALCEADIQKYLDMRKPGGGGLATSRKEADEVHILSGVFEGKTTGTPISLLMYNTSQHSADYDALRDIFRPGHADMTFAAKYGVRDHRGGGRASGRETAARTAAGAVAMRLLEETGINVSSRIVRLAGRDIPYDCEDTESLTADIMKTLDADDSYGGVIECRCTGLPAGLGEPVFDKLDALAAQAVMSIGAVKSVEIGDGLAAADLKGSENNDVFYSSSEGEADGCRPGTVKKRTNHSGGTLGGISDGDVFVLRAAFKPTPSIAKTQETVNAAGENTLVTIGGRHDRAVVSRAPVVVSSMVALVLADLLLRNMSARMDHVLKIYEKSSHADRGLSGR